MNDKELAPKVMALYGAVIALLREGADLNNVTVAEIAARAGIGKGTVYEYFSNKEEMIAQALFHELKADCQQMYGLISREKDLYEKMNLVLIRMEEKMAEMNCFVRTMQIMLDNSVISSRMREMAENKKEEDILVTDVIRKIIDDEGGTVEKLSKEKRCHLLMTIFSRLICYVLYQFDAKVKMELDNETMRAMICQDVCRDLEAFKKEN